MSGSTLPEAGSLAVRTVAICLLATHIWANRGPLKEYWLQCMDSVKRLFWNPKVKSAVDEHFVLKCKEEMKLQRIHQFLLLCRTAMHLQPLACTVAIFACADDSGPFAAMLVVVVLVQLLFQWIASHGEQVPPALMDFLAFFIVIGSTISICNMQGDVRCFLSAGPRVLEKSVAMLMLMDYRKTAPLLLLSSAASLWAYRRNLQVFKEDALPTDHMIMVVVTEAIPTLILTGLSIAYETACEELVRHKVEAESARASVHQILTVVCDAVVNIDDHFRISHPAPQLAHRLHHDNRSSGGGACNGFQLQGCCFHELTATDEDRERFLAFVHSSRGESQGTDDGHGLSPPTTLHLNLKDSVGSVVPVQLFHSFQFRQLGHVLGVRERKDFPEASWAETPHLHGGPNQPNQAHQLHEPMTSDFERPTDASLMSRSAARSVINETRSNPDTWIVQESVERIKIPQLAEVVVCCDAMSERLSATDFSLQFASRHSSTHEVTIPDLMDWTSVSSARELRRWIQGSVGSSGTATLGEHGMRFCIPFGASHIALVASRAFMTTTDSEIDVASSEGSEPFQPITLMLRGLELLQNDLQYHRNSDDVASVIETLEA